MKLPIILCALVFAALFVVTPTQNLEAGHHNRFSFNIGTFFPSPSYVVVQPQPTYVESRVYMDPYGYPMQESVYVYPRPYYRRAYVCPAPVVSGFSFGARFR